MKKALLLLLCAASLWGCKKEDDLLPVSQPETEKPVGAITDKGTPEGTPVSASIGAEGGSITSTDGRITLAFPAGALTTTTNITIQPVSNKMPNGKGVAYRFSPGELQLSKPVSLQFNYADTDVEGTTPEALGIAYQSADGTWEIAKDATVNTAQKTITKDIKNLKDQSLFSKYLLIPGKASLQPNEGIELQVRVVQFRFPRGDGKSEDLLMEGEKLADASQIKSWKLNGQNGPTSGASGSLSGAMGAKMNYKAPAAPPAQNPVAVSVEVDGPSGSKIIMVSHISITGKKYRMELDWQRVSTCSPGAIASFTYNTRAMIDFELDNNSKVKVTKIENLVDIEVKDVVSCNPLFYSASGEVDGIHLTGMTGEIDAATGQLKFAFQGNWMDFPTFTLVFVSGETTITDESFQTFEGINGFTKMPFKDGQVLNLRGANNTGFIFTLNRAD